MSSSAGPSTPSKASSSSRPSVATSSSLSQPPPTPNSARRASVRWSDEPDSSSPPPNVSRWFSPPSASSPLALSSNVALDHAQTVTLSPEPLGDPELGPHPITAPGEQEPRTVDKGKATGLSYAEHRAGRCVRPAPPPLRVALPMDSTPVPAPLPALEPSTEPFNHASAPACDTNGTLLSPPNMGSFAPAPQASPFMYPAFHPYHPNLPAHAFAPYHGGQGPSPTCSPAVPAVGAHHGPSIPQPVYHGYLPPQLLWRFDPSSPMPPGTASSLPGYSSVPVPPPPPPALGTETTEPPRQRILPYGHAMYDETEGLAALREERGERCGSTETLVDRAEFRAKAEDLEAGNGGLDHGDGPTNPRDPQHRTAAPPRPALKRFVTEDSVVLQPQRNAAHIVQSHIAADRKGLGGAELDALDDEDKTTEPTGGVLSHLLKLYGDDRMDMYRTDSGASFATTVGDHSSVAASRTTSLDSQMPPHHGLGLRQRRGGGGGELDEKGDYVHQMSRRPSDTGSIDSTMSVAKIKSYVAGKFKSKKGKKRSRRASITKHVADILQRQQFVLKLAKALMITGAPSHRLESQLSATARVLEIDAQFVHLPAIVIATFGDYETRTSETHFVKAAGGELDVGRLHRVHEIYKRVVHDKMGVTEGSALLHQLLNEPPVYSLWQRVMFSAIGCGVICMLGFDGSFIDSFIAALFGGFLSFMQLRAAKNQLFSNIFEISIATVISFIARALSTTDYFCYEAVSSAGVSLILPGYAILCGSLELASKNLIAGSVRMVYAIIYSLFLGFGLSIGSDFYFLFDPADKARILADAGPPVYTVSGTFSGLNGTLPVSLATISLTNATDSHSSAFDDGDVHCLRRPEWQWYRQGVSPWWMFLLVPAFSFTLALISLQPLKTKELPVMVIIACVGFTCNFFANQYIFDRGDIVSFIGSFVVGLLGNMYSRVFKSTAFTNMVVGVLFLVPSGISAAGGLAMTYRTASGDSYSTGLVIGFRMISTAIGITVGLFFSSFVVYSFGRGKSSAAFTF